MYPNQNNPSQPNQPVPQPDPHAPQPLPQYPSPYPPSMGQQSWQQPQAQYQAVDPTPQLPQPQLPGQQPLGNRQPSPPLTPSYNPTPSASSNGSSKKKSILVAVAVIIALLALSAAAYFLMNAMKSDNKPAPAADQTNQQQPAPAATSALASLGDITLLPPNDLSRYTANTENTELVMAYNTEGDVCSLQLGVVDEATLPGKDMKDIVDRQIKALQDQGVKVEGPTEGDALTLKDVADSKKAYTVPTMIFVATDANNKQVRSHYSAAVLKDGKRVYVMRTCQVPNGTVDEAKVAPLDNDAKQITVRVK